MHKFDYIKRNLFIEFLKKINNVEISYIWYGYANALFLECGALDRESKEGNPCGDITFMLDCGWRLESQYTVIAGIDSGDKKLKNLSRSFISSKIVSVDIEGKIPELCISLGNGNYFRTFQTYEGPPKWSISVRDYSKYKIGLNKEGEFAVYYKNKSFICERYCGGLRIKE